jgi:N-acetyl-anhydromuramyl-L-alanine amidase AmpD
MKNDPAFIIIHHSATADSDSSSWNAIREYHIGLGWNDIGYHFGIEKIDGKYNVLVGRMLDEVGAHCKQARMNSRSIGICCVGMFDEVAPSHELLAVLRRLVLSLMRVFDISVVNVRGHNDYAPKSCPGKMFDMNLFRKSLVEL